MVLLNLEIIDLNRILEDFMLYLFNDDILAINQNQDITGTQFTGIRPTLNRRIERVAGRSVIIGFQEL